MKASFCLQLKALLKRNFLLKRRNKKQLLQEIFFPVFFVSLMAMIKAFTEPKTFPPVKSFPANPLTNPGFHLNLSNKLLVTPKRRNIQNIMTSISSVLGGIQYEIFESQVAAEKAYKANPTKVAAGIIFDYGNKKLSYAIRMPYRSLPFKKQIFTPALNQGDCRNSLNGTKAGRKCKANLYLTSGFVWLQNAIDTALIKQFHPAFSVPQVSVQLMPKDKFTESLDSIQIGSVIYFVFAYSFFINFLVVNLVSEKERKIREGMKMMGLRDSVWWLAWALVYMLIILFVTGIVVSIAHVTSFLAKSNMLILFILLFLYGISIINLAFVMTPFFRKAEVAGIVSGFFTLLISLLYFVVSMSRTRTSTGYKYDISTDTQWALCFLSPVAFALAMDQGIFLDIAKDGMTFSSLRQGDFPLYAPIAMLLLDSVLYIVLAVYLDHVVPGDYGPLYKPWFFLMPSYWCNSKQKRSSELKHLLDDEESITYRDDVEPVSSNLAKNAGIRITRITKCFRDQKTVVTAVNKLSLDIYEGQITAVLGHNGAGKTTLISMLCGLLPPTSGTAVINGMDVSHSGDMEKIRSMTGVCPQHDILYDELTCQEHLMIFAGIKGANPNKTIEIVEKILKDIDLTEQADTFARNLSGGQKRKLSVAIALIGNPKILFLDEPTAGMDPFSRRHLWSLLKANKEGKIILLTTHFMDEADILADRKAIVSHGKLKCCGSSLFLKQRFGIGYHLNMVVDPDSEAEKVMALLKRYVSGVKMKRSHGKELAFTMPVNEVTKFPELFSALEKPNQLQSLGIKAYGVSMTTLEEVFLKIGSESEGKDIETSQHSHNTLLEVSLDDKNLKSRRFWTLLRVRFLLKIRTIKALIFQIMIPIILVVIGCVISKKSYSDDTSGPIPLTFNKLYVVPNGPPLLAIDGEGTSESNIFIETLRKQYVIDRVNASVDIADLPEHWLGFNLTDIKKSSSSEYIALYNDSAIHSLPAVINAISNGFLSFMNSKERITLTSLMWPSVAQSGIPQLSYNSNAFTAAFVLAVAFVVVPSGFAIETVYDRQIKARIQLRVSGVTFSMYWITSFLFHLCIYVIPAVICIVIVFAVEIQSFNNEGAMLSLVLLFITYIPANLTLSYVLSFAFDKKDSCQAVLPNVFIFSGIIPYIAVSLMDMLSKPDTAKTLHYVLAAMDPPYVVFGGIYFIDRISQVANIQQTSVEFDDYFSWKSNIPYTILVSVVHFEIMLLLLYYFDMRHGGGSVGDQFFSCGKSNSRVIPEDNKDIPEDEDDDVTQERYHVSQLQKTSGKKTVAFVENLRKEFPGKNSGQKESNTKVAVRNVTFAIDRGEVFGLLGPNGAGKTTTLSMITGEVAATRGKVIVGGHNIFSNVSDAFQAIGYCPQHDALWNVITLKEHLEIYANLKGVSKSDIGPTFNQYGLVQSLKLEDHTNKWAQKMSGGTQRKLSYAISMLGKPKIVLMDEPSTGMDPESKRFLWDTISSSFKSSGRGAILTTHYMEEADALCSRVAIMVNGQLQCIGPTQHLKDKFGSGYILEIKLQIDGRHIENQMDKLESHLKTLFHDIDCLERFAERGRYRIAENDKMLSESFSALESMKHSHNVEEYSFSQSSLEQIFLDFAKKQLDEEVAEFKVKGKKKNPPSGHYNSSRNNSVIEFV